MINKIQSLELKDFFDVYPKIIPKIENESIHIFKKCFKQIATPLEKLNDVKSKNNRYSFNKSKPVINIINRKSRKSINMQKVNIFNRKKLSKGHLFSSLNNSEKYSIDNSNISYLNAYNQEMEEDDEYKEVNEENQNIDNDLERDYFLINKGIFLQNKEKKRTEDVKYGLELFFFSSNFFENLSKNLNRMNLKIKNLEKLLVDRKKENKQEKQSKIKNKLKNIVNKLSEKVVLKKYEKDNFVVKMNEIGKDCFFLISGKISILKPIEYNKKMNFREYFIYLKCLLNFDEIELVLKVLSLNRKVLDINNIDEISKLIRAYFIILLRRELKRNYDGITMEILENFFKLNHFTFEDFQLSKDKILKNIEKKEEDMNNHNNFEILLLNYISGEIPLLNEDIYLLELYRIINNENEKYSITLYKYEIFLYLYPGSFFGDMALESKIKKRNATIRTETDCIICSLSNAYYISLLSEENKKLKTIDLIFLCHNFFFNLISPVIFNKTYYPMFKSVEKIKNEVLYQQNDDISSLYLLKEGTIKIELNANAFDLFDIIKKILIGIYSRINYFKISLEDILEIKNNYLHDKHLSAIYNNEKIFLEAKKKINFELFTSNGYEFLGIQDFCLKKKYLCSCTVISNKALFMEIQKKDLSYIITNEKEILSDYYNYVYKKLILLIKRIHYLKKNLINQLLNKFDIISYNNYKYSFESNNKSQIINNMNIQGNNNHKQKIQVLYSEKAKNIYNEKINIERNLMKNFSRSFYIKFRNYLSLNNKNSNIYNNSSKRLLKLNKYNLKNKRSILSHSHLNTLQNDSLQINKHEPINTTLSISKTKNKNNNNEEIIKKISNNLVNTKHGYISAKKIKKIILKNNEENKKISKLNIVRKFILSNNEEKSLEFNYSYLNNNKYINKMSKNISIKKKKYDDNKNNLLIKDKQENISNIFENGIEMDNSSNRGNKSSLNIKIKSSISNICYNNSKEKLISDIKKERNNSSSITSLPDINKTYKKINNLIRIMKRNYAISKGQKKFILYRKSKKNKAINLIEDKNINTFRQKTFGQSIKDYYFKKRVEGYSALFNPLYNTYINRQTTIKIKKNK